MGDGGTDVAAAILGCRRGWASLPPGTDARIDERTRNNLDVWICRRFFQPGGKNVGKSKRPDCFVCAHQFVRPFRAARMPTLYGSQGWLPLHLFRHHPFTNFITASTASSALMAC